MPKVIATNARPRASLSRSADDRDALAVPVFAIFPAGDPSSFATRSKELP
jgi:hypothetical protein